MNINDINIRDMSIRYINIEDTNIINMNISNIHIIIYRENGDIYIKNINIYNTKTRKVHKYHNEFFSFCTGCALTIRNILRRNTIAYSERK